MIRIQYGALSRGKAHNQYIKLFTSTFGGRKVSISDLSKIDAFDAPFMDWLVRYTISYISKRPEMIEPALSVLKSFATERMDKYALNWQSMEGSQALMSIYTALLAICYKDTIERPMCADDCVLIRNIKRETSIAIMNAFDSSFDIDLF